MAGEHPIGWAWSHDCYTLSCDSHSPPVYQTYIGAMNERIRRQIAISNPFVFKHISNLKVCSAGYTQDDVPGAVSLPPICLPPPFWQNVEQFDDIGPCVIMASPGMMQSGLSRQLFEAWCTDKRNGVIVAGYCVEGTLAKVGG